MHVCTHLDSVQDNEEAVRAAEAQLKSALAQQVHLCQVQVRHCVLKRDKAHSISLDGR